MTIQATPTPGSKLLTPHDHTLIMIDFQSQMSFATKSIDAVNLRNNAALVANAAKGFGVSTILTTVAEKSFSGPMFSEITEAFPGQKLFDRTSMNTWEDAEVIKEINKIGKKRIVLSGLWTGVCIVGPALSAIEQGFRSLRSRRRMRRRFDRSPRPRDGPHGSGWRAADDLAAVHARASARLGAHRDLRHDYRHRQEVRRLLRSRHHLRQADVRRIRSALIFRYDILYVPFA
jgi:hypothetical protein